MFPVLTRRAWMSGAAALLAAPPAIAQAPTRIEIPFRLFDNQPLTQVTINGQGPYWFLIDTGASGFALDAQLARDLRLEVVGVGQAQGAVGRVQMAIHRARELVLGGRLRDNRVQIAGIPSLASSRFQGLFPMARGVAETGFDFDRRVFIVDTRPGDTHEGFDRLEARVDTSGWGTAHPSPRVRVDVDGRPATLLLDTGANGGLFLKPDFVRRHRLWEANPRYVDAASMGVAGLFRSRATTADELQFGRYRFRDLPVRLGHPDDSGRDGYGSHDGLLGMEVIRRLNLYLKPRRDQLWIRANSHIDDIYRYNRSGMELEWKNNQVRVLAVAEGSAADRAGLRAADVITASTAGEGSFDGLAWALTDAPGTVIGLSVSTDGAAARDVEVVLVEPFAPSEPRSRVAPDAPAN